MERMNGFLEWMGELGFQNRYPYPLGLDLSSTAACLQQRGHQAGREVGGCVCFS